MKKYFFPSLLFLSKEQIPLFYQKASFFSFV